MFPSSFNVVDYYIYQRGELTFIILFLFSRLLRESTVVIIVRISIQFHHRVNVNELGIFRITLRLIIVKGSPKSITLGENRIRASLTALLNKMFVRMGWSVQKAWDCLSFALTNTD